MSPAQRQTAWLALGVVGIVVTALAGKALKLAGVPVGLVFSVTACSMTAILSLCICRICQIGQAAWLDVVTRKNG